METVLLPYIITYRDKRFWLLGKITVDAIVGQREAERILDAKPGQLWEASHHILAAPGKAMPVRLVDCGDALSQIQVIVRDRPERVKRPISVQRFQTMRKITPDSGVLFDDLLAPGGNA